MDRDKLSRRVKLTIEQKCEMVKSDVVVALESTICIGNWRDYISRRELYSLVFGVLGIDEKDMKRYPEVMTVIKQEVKTLFDRDCVQICSIGKARGYRGLKKKEAN